MWLDKQSGKPTRYNLMQEVLDIALKVSVDKNDLRKALREQGYELDAVPARKYATLQRIGSKKAVRLYRLGEDYDLPAIRERIEENRQRYAHDFSYQRIHPKRFQLNESFSTVKKIGGLRGLYLHYCYCLGIIPKHSARRPLSPELREECRRLNAYSRQTQLLCREKLDTVEDVQAFIDESKAELGRLQAARQKCGNRLRRCDDRAEIAISKVERDKLTAAMALCRKDIKTTGEVLARSDKLKENLKLEKEMQAQRMGRMTQKKCERSVAR